MKWQPGKSPAQRMMQNTQAIQQKWRRDAGGYYLLQQQKLREQQAVKLMLQLPASVDIREVWPEYNTKHQHQLGMHIHTAFSIRRFLRRTGIVSAFFYFSNGVPLKDFNYATSADPLCVASYFTPEYDHAIYGDFVLFMPYSHLHMRRGKYDLKFSVEIWDDGHRVLATSQDVPFTYTEG